VPQVNNFSVGDRVMIDCIEGFGGPATVIETRQVPPSPYKVRMDDGKIPPFWAHDFEVSTLSETFDSRPDTYAHIQLVQRFMGRAIADLLRRQQEHDQSKLISPEKEAYDVITPRLRGLTYGSEEYRAGLREMKPAIDHHYATNDHHPEHTPAGIEGMSLLSLLEMLCDWLAATRRHDDGDIRKSIEINQQRFGYSDELKQVLLNTLPAIEESNV
jgi:hypothetical protein